MKRLVTHVSLNGFKEVNNLAWFNVAKRNDKTNLQIDKYSWSLGNRTIYYTKRDKEHFNTDWYERDKQNVPQAALFFSSSVEFQLREAGDTAEADFCLLIREYFEVFDKSGISHEYRLERVEQFLDYFETDFLLHLYSN